MRLLTRLYSIFYNNIIIYLPPRARDIGVWFDVMRGMVFVGILTNCAILGFSSEQLMQWLPSLFTRSISDGDQLMALGSGRYLVQSLSIYALIIKPVGVIA